MSSQAAFPRSSFRRPLAAFSWLVMILVIAILLLLRANAALAAPVAPDLVRLTQPDGATFMAQPFGDEWYSGYEYKGYTILRSPDTDFWVYAELDRAHRLVPGTMKVAIDAAPAALEPRLRDRQAVQAAAAAATPSMVAPEEWSGSLGAGKVLIILTDFTPSTSLGTTEAQWSAEFFDNASGVKSVKNYYEQASFGKFTMEPAAESYGAVNDGVVAVTMPYANAYPWTDEGEWQSVRDALVAADPYLDFGALDINGNGSLDNSELHLVLIVRGYEESYGGEAGACAPNVWGHRWSLPTSSCDTYCAPVLDGVRIGAFADNGGYTREGEWHEFNSEPPTGMSCSAAYGHPATIGIMVHELGHDIDWPDLYDIDYTSEGVGNWSIMAGGSWGRAGGDAYSGVTPVLPDAFLKWYQHWLSPISVTAPQAGVAIPDSAENDAAYLLGVNRNGVDWDSGVASGAGEYFLVENRQQVGFDAGLQRMGGDAEGCLIWHIDETRTKTNSANADETRKLVDLEEAEGTQDLDDGSNSGDGDDPWPGNSGTTTFDDTSTPNGNWYDGSTSGMAVTNISTAGTGCTVDFSGAGPAWTGSAGTNWSAASNWTTGRTPNENDNTIIPAGAPSAPDVDTAASVCNISILDGAQVNASADVPLTVYGDWTEAGSGRFDASAGSVVFAASSAQTITSGTNTHFNSLYIGNGSTTQAVTAGSDLVIHGDLVVQPGAALVADSHTISVGGNWTDNAFGFSPGTGTVRLTGAAQTVQRANDELVVYSDNLTSTSGWVIYDANADGWTWYYSTNTTTPNSPDSGQHARCQTNFDNATIASDDWLFSPGFSLTAGVTYRIGFNYGAGGSSWPEKLAVHIGMSRTVPAMTTQFFDNQNITNTSWLPGSGTFAPSTSGTYYVGFHAHSDPSRYRVGIDDLVVSASDPNPRFNDLEVTGAGTVTLGDSAAVSNNLTIATGSTLALGAYDLTVDGAVTNNGALAQTKTVNAANTAFLNLKNKAGTADKYFGAAIDPGAGNMGSTTVKVSGNQLCAGAHAGVKRCFDLAPTAPQTAAVTFYYTEAERSGANASNLLVYHWNGSTSAWDLQGGTTTRGGSGDSQWARVTGVAAYSPFALNSDSPLAVALSTLTARPTHQAVELTWETVSELDNAGFNIHRVEGSGTSIKLNSALIPAIAPGSSEGHVYTWLDGTVLPGASYVYRLEVVDRSGLSEIVQAIAVDVPISPWAWLPMIGR